MIILEHIKFLIFVLSNIVLHIQHICFGKEKWISMHKLQLIAFNIWACFWER